MKKKLFSVLIAVTIYTFCYSQTDTIFTNNQKISCIIKEITTESVKYSYINEDMINSIYKNAVQKIIFKNGRVQTFAETTSYKKITDLSEFENVTITQVENEVKGLFKVGDVSSKAKGTTELSNQERVKKRAYRKLKIQAAIMGANIVYIINQRSEGNKEGGLFESSTTSETSLTGVAYTNQLPNFDDFKLLIRNKKKFNAVFKYSLYSSSSDIKEKSILCDFIIQNITNENGLILIKGVLDNDEKYTNFRVVSFDNSKFHIFYQDKNTVYNIQIKL